MVGYQPCFPPCSGGRFLLTFGPAGDGGSTPQFGEALRFVSTALHSYSNGGTRAGRFQRGHLRRNFEDVVSLWLNCYIGPIAQQSRAAKTPHTDKPRMTRGTLSI